jgi:heterotetrameric sarcosine oxidase gamma subunit
VSLEFLAVEATAVGDDRTVPLARSPMEGQARAAGARFAARGGWNVAVACSDPEQEREAVRASGAWADVSHIGKLELQASATDLAEIVGRAGDGVQLRLGWATRAAQAWWCPLTPERALILCAPSSTAELRTRLGEAAADSRGTAGVVEVTTLHAALTLCGPTARDVFARFTAIDLRPQSLPVSGVRPGSVARTPGMILREADERFLMLFGWALGEYMWTVVEDAGRRLGARPVGVDALEPLDAPLQEAARGA